MEIRYSKRATKFIKKQDTTTQKRIIKAIENLPNGDVIILTNSKNKYRRLRVGSFRIIFDDKGTIIIIIDVDNRGEVYNRY